MTLIDRAVAPTDLEIRGDGRTVYGIAVPFDQEATVNDGFGNYREVFRRGSFARTINAGAARVKFLVNHDRKHRLPIGKAVSLREDAAGLIGEFRVSETRDGDEVLELIRDGVLDAFSVGFAPVKDRDSKGLVERLEVKLSEVSTVAFPAYAGAAISGVRSVLLPIEEWEKFAMRDLGASVMTLEEAIALHQGHMDGTEPVSDESQERLMALMKEALGQPVKAMTMKSSASTPGGGSRLALNLGTHRTEPAAGTSDADSPATQDDPVVGHSSRTRTRNQRRALAAITLERLTP